MTWKKESQKAMEWHEGVKFRTCSFLSSFYSLLQLQAGVIAQWHTNNKQNCHIMSLPSDQRKRWRGRETLQPRRSLHCHCRQISETWDLHCVSWIAWQWEDTDTLTQHARMDTHWPMNTPISDMIWRLRAELKTENSN